ncbi:uncharacterized protein LOC128181872 isoform X2 [Crassostrea angulata]|uniref:uncharacterized protein LOC128181872 isoform X2 n=1 Tax=Magallana angulata TaxID=2784310 RepID=UPI0022B13E18|nr:uncharacterized protein LOC128181872 isoform X2 [Crassostrea angulata]
MSKKLQMMLRFGLIVVLITQVISRQERSFVIAMANVRFDLWIISSLSARSRLDCSRTCEIHSTCLSFEYTPLTGECRLFDTIFLHQDAGVYEIGWQYYIASNRRCRHPFIDGRDLDICFTFVGFHNLTEAKAKCAAIQSSIISITSDEQQDFLTRLAGTLLNIPFPGTSYTRPFIQGFWDGTDWILDNGTPLVYTNWGTGEPQNTDTNRYIKLRKGKWRTSLDLNIRPVFCSYKP